MRRHTLQSRTAKVIQEWKSEKMNALRIREFGPSDYQPYQAIHDSLFPAHTFHLERVKYEDSCFGRTRYKMKRVVAETETGEVVGVGEFNHLWFSYHPRRFALSLEVHPNWQRRGVGGMLYEYLLSELRNADAEVMWPLVLSDSKSSVTFLTKRGFVEKRRMFESRLDLTSFNPEVARAKAERLETEGIVISDLAAEMDEDPDAGKKLFDLEQSAGGDVPSLVEFSPMDYRDYEIIILKSPILVWEGSFVAKEGDRFVGSSSLDLAERDDLLGQGFTAVRPGYRGRGIAQAVKVKVAEYCKMRGVKYLRTHNDSDNLPMLAVNWKLGFVKRNEWIAFEKKV